MFLYVFVGGCRGPFGVCIQKVVWSSCNYGTLMGLWLLCQHDSILTELSYFTPNEGYSLWLPYSRWFCSVIRFGEVLLLDPKSITRHELSISYPIFITPSPTPFQSPQGYHPTPLEWERSQLQARAPPPFVYKQFNATITSVVPRLWVGQVDLIFMCHWWTILYGPTDDIHMACTMFMVVDGRPVLQNSQCVTLLVFYDFGHKF